EHGFRLPSALDNRPLRFEEWEELVPRALFVSATPGDYELEKSGGGAVEQLIRPTGLLDPEVEVRPIKGQVDDLIAEIREREAKGERVLVTTLTKRMAEDLTDYLQQIGIRVRYMHSDIDAIERMEILRDLRLGKFDVLVGINLLREGLDLPEVSLVAILDADKEGFLRDERSLIQTIGRAARNAQAKAIMYADRITGSMRRCIDETNRRREVQRRYNEEHGIIPQTIVKSVEERLLSTRVADARAQAPAQVKEEPARYGDEVDLEEWAKILEQQMREAAAMLDFERAAVLRDELLEVKAKLGGAGNAPARGGAGRAAGGRRTGVAVGEAILGPALLTEAELEASGRSIGRTVEPPVVLALRGELGAGKSVLARAVARGAGVTGALPSPTFNLVYRYEADRGIVVHHLDLYRLEDAEEVWELGWAELGEDRDVVLIEWPERAESLLPARRWDIYLAIPEPGAMVRRVRAVRRGAAPALPELPVGGAETGSD